MVISLESLRVKQRSPNPLRVVSRLKKKRLKLLRRKSLVLKMRKAL